MPKESLAYRDNLEDLLDFFHGRRMLTLQDVCKYLQKDPRWVKTRFGLDAKMGISVPTLARRLADGV